MPTDFEEPLKSPENPKYARKTLKFYINYQVHKSGNLFLEIFRANTGWTHTYEDHSTSAINQ